MSDVVFKYEVASIGAEIRTQATHLMPRFSEVVSVGLQGDSVVIWVRQPFLESTERRTFAVFGTGHQLPSTAIFCGTVRVPNGLVLHVFEVYS